MKPASTEMLRHCTRPALLLSCSPAHLPRHRLTDIRHPTSDCEMPARASFLPAVFLEREFSFKAQNSSTRLSSCRCSMHCHLQGTSKPDIDCNNRPNKHAVHPYHISTHTFDASPHFHSICSYMLPLPDSVEKNTGLEG